MATPLKINNAGGTEIKQFTTAEENYIAYQIGLHLAASGSNGTGSITTNASHTSIGSYTDTFYNEPVGTHPSTSITSGSTTTTVYQNQGTAVETDSDVLSPIMWVDSGGQTGFKEMPDADLNEAVDRYLSTIFTNDYPGVFKLGSSSPGPDYSVWLSSVFTDTRTDGTSVSYNIYRRDTYTPPSTVSPLYVRDNAGFDGIQAMTDRQIKYTFGQRAKTRIGVSKIGSYQIRTATAGAPTDPGTWVSAGAATDTIQSTADQSFTSVFTIGYGTGYTRGYTGAYTGNYTKAYSAAYTNSYSGAAFTSAYSKSFTRVDSESFNRPYTKAYTSNYALAYTRVQQEAFNRPYTRSYTSNYGKGYTRIQQEIFNRPYTNVFLRDYIKGYTRQQSEAFAVNYTITFANTFGANYTRNYISNYARNYVPNYDRVYAGGNYARHFNTTLTYVGAYISNYTSPSAYDGGYTGTRAGNYASSRIPATYTGNSQTADTTKDDDGTQWGIGIIGAYLTAFAPQYSIGNIFFAGSANIGYFTGGRTSAHKAFGYIRGYAGPGGFAYYDNYRYMGDPLHGGNLIFYTGENVRYYVSGTPSTGYDGAISASRFTASTFFRGRYEGLSGVSYEGLINRGYSGVFHNYVGTVPYPFGNTSLGIGGTQKAYIRGATYVTFQVFVPTFQAVDGKGPTWPGGGTAGSPGYVGFVYFVTNVNTGGSLTYANFVDAIYTGAPVNEEFGRVFYAATGNYQNEFGTVNYIRTLSYQRNYVRNYARGFAGTAFVAGYQNEFGAAYLRNYTRNYTSVYAGNYTGLYTSLYENQYNTAYTIQYIKPYTGPYTSLYTSEYQKEFNRPYTNTYTGPYTSLYTSEYQKEFNAPYTNTYTGAYTSVYTGAYSKAYTGTYDTTYITDYIQDYTEVYDKLFESTYAAEYIGDYIGNFEGLTIQSGSETDETYTLYVRIG